MSAAAPKLRRMLTTLLTQTIIDDRIRAAAVSAQKPESSDKTIELKRGPSSPPWTIVVS